MTDQVGTSKVAVTTETVRAGRNQKSLDMLKDLRELVQYIQRAKLEIASLRPDEIKSRHLSVASDELDAIVRATEEATNEIMEAAEAIESVAGELTGAAEDVVGDAVTKIYQACSFQDITGQRISKVVGALKHIEQKVERMVVLLGGAAAVAPELEDEEEDGDDPEAKLLNGPQLPGHATSQDEIDALFN